MVPSPVFPLATPSTDQLTAPFEIPVIAALNCCSAEGATVEDCGERVKEKTVAVAVRLTDELAVLVAVTV